MKRVIVFALTIALCFCAFSPCVFADSIDFLKLGKISLTLNYQGEPVDQGSFALYRVAFILPIQNSISYHYTSFFDGCTASLDNISSSQTAKEIAQFAADNQLTATEASVNANGRVSFAPLDLGLYLIVQTQADEDFYPIDPFLVSMPMDENGSYVYDVDATPKLQLVKQEPDKPDAPDKPNDPDKPDAPDKPNDPDDPGGGGGGGGGGSDDGEDDDYTPDDKKQDDVKSENEKGEKLPDTGLNSLPVPILTACGCCLVVIGWYLNATGKKR